MTRILLTHYRQVSLDNTRTHAITYVSMPTRDAQDNDMLYYFLADSLTNDFHTTVLLYSDIYTIADVPVTSALLKQIIILTRVDNPASTMHTREMLIESKRKLLLLTSRATSRNSIVGYESRWAAFTHENKKRLTFSTISGRPTKRPQMKSSSSTLRTSRASVMIEELLSWLRTSW